MLLIICFYCFPQCTCLLWIKLTFICDTDWEKLKTYQVLFVGFLIFQSHPSSCDCCWPAGRSAQPGPSPGPPWAGGRSDLERWAAPQTSSPYPPLPLPPGAAATAGPAGGAEQAAAELVSTQRMRRRNGGPEQHPHPVVRRTPPPGGGGAVGAGEGGDEQRGWWRVDSQNEEGRCRTKPWPRAAHSASCPQPGAQTLQGKANG